MTMCLFLFMYLAWEKNYTKEMLGGKNTISSIEMRAVSAGSSFKWDAWSRGLLGHTWWEGRSVRVSGGFSQLPFVESEDFRAHRRCLWPVPRSVWVCSMSSAVRNASCSLRSRRQNNRCPLLQSSPKAHIFSSLNNAWAWFTHVLLI